MRTSPQLPHKPERERNNGDEPPLQEVRALHSGSLPVTSALMLDRADVRACFSWRRQLNILYASQVTRQPEERDAVLAASAVIGATHGGAFPWPPQWSHHHLRLSIAPRACRADYVLRKTLCLCRLHGSSQQLRSSKQGLGIGQILIRVGCRSILQQSWRHRHHFGAAGCVSTPGCLAQLSSTGWKWMPCMHA